MKVKKILAGVTASILTLAASIIPAGNNLFDTVQTEFTAGAGFSEDTSSIPEVLDEQSGLNYKLIDMDGDGISDYVEISGCSNKSVTSVNVPESIGGVPVWFIKSGAFYGFESLVSVTLPAAVEAIGYGAFCQCKALREVTIINPETEFLTPEGEIDEELEYYWTICNGDDNENSKGIYEGVICAPTGSRAHSFAAINGYEFKSLDEMPSTAPAETTPAVTEAPVITTPEETTTAAPVQTTVPPTATSAAVTAPSETAASAPAVTTEATAPTAASVPAVTTEVTSSEVTSAPAETTTSSAAATAAPEATTTTAAPEATTTTAAPEATTTTAAAATEITEKPASTTAVTSDASSEATAPATETTAASTEAAPGTSAPESTTAAVSGTPEDTTTDVTDITPGDVDGDNEITIRDAVLIRRFLAGGWNVKLDEKAADVDGSGDITIKDVVLIRRYLAGGWNVKL